MAALRKEKMVLDSLYDLVRHMGAIREGRTAVITVSDGWVLYGPDPTLTIPRKNDYGRDADPPRGEPPPVGVGGGGTLMARPNNHPEGPADRTECERDLMELANLNDGQYFRDLFGEANR